MVIHWQKYWGLKVHGQNNANKEFQSPYGLGPRLRLGP